MTPPGLNEQQHGKGEQSAAGSRPTARVSIQVYDPPMCCSTGVCGPVVDPVLPQFVADLDWLVSNGVPVERYNLVQEPHAFAANRQVQQALAAEGADCLPLILVNGVIVSGILPEAAIASMEEQLSGACTVEIAAFDEFTNCVTGCPGCVVRGIADRRCWKLCPVKSRASNCAGEWSAFVLQP